MNLQSVIFFRLSCEFRGGGITLSVNFKSEERYLLKFETILFLSRIACLSSRFQHSIFANVIILKFSRIFS